MVAMLCGVFAFGVISLVGGGPLALRETGKPRTESTHVARDVRRRERDPEVGAEEG